MRRLLTVLLPIAFLVAACSDPAPSAPSPVTVGAGGSGTTITGTILDFGGTTPASTLGATVEATTGISVTVVSTGQTAAVNPQGHFVLVEVPGGTLELQFSGPGIGGTLVVTDVVAGSTIELTLQVSGSQVTLESERRSTGGEDQLEGRVESLPPTTAAGTVIVAGHTVLTDAATQYVQGSQPGAFADLTIGQRVHVKGQATDAGLLARLIDLQNPDVDLPVNVNGVVAGLTGDAASFRFVIGSREVRGDDATTFFGGSEFADLMNGARVEVKGAQRDGFVYATRLHVSRDDDGDDGDSDIGGTLTAISGTAPALTLVVGGATVTTTAATEIRRRGDRLTFAVLQAGMQVDVSATSSGGSTVARKITIAEHTWDVDVEGAIESAIATSGCPALSFTVAGVSYHTTSYTEFKKTLCSELAMGMTVKIRGVLRPDNSVEVTRIEGV